jgi:hypothetical protein
MHQLLQVSFPHICIQIALCLSVYIFHSSLSLYFSLAPPLTLALSLSASLSFSLTLSLAHSRSLTLSLTHSLSPTLTRSLCLAHSLSYTHRRCRAGRGPPDGSWQRASRPLEYTWALSLSILLSLFLPLSLSHTHALSLTHTHSLTLSHTQTHTQAVSSGAGAPSGRLLAAIVTPVFPHILRWIDR